MENFYSVVIAQYLLGKRFQMLQIGRKLIQTYFTTVELKTVLLIPRNRKTFKTPYEDILSNQT